MAKGLAADGEDDNPLKELAFSLPSEKDGLFEETPVDIQELIESTE